MFPSLEYCIERVEEEGFAVIDWDDGRDFEYVVQKIAELIDRAYDRDLDEKTIRSLIVEMHKRRDKIEALYSRIISIA